MSEEISSYLDSIEEYIFDEKKIVTCSWLSKTLAIHTNLSKQLLHTFYDQSPKKEELSLTYILIGSPNGDGKCQISIVKDKDLKECESSWKIISSKHIYSVQKCSDLADLNVLYTAQKGETTDTLSKGISAIDFNCIERDNSLIAKLRSDALPAPSKQPLGAVKKPAPQPPAKTKSPNKKQEDKSSEEDKAATSKGKGSVIPSMFKNSKPAENKTGSTNKPAEKPAANKKKSQGIGAFFSKTSKPSNETKVPEESKKVIEEKEPDTTERHSPSKENKPTLNIVKEDKVEKKTNVKDNKAKVDEPKEISPKSKKPPTKQKATTKKGNSKKGSTKKVEKEQKKRKRLVVVSDSESENSCEEEDVEMREPTPEPEPTVVPDDDDDDDIVCATPEPASRKRKKKLISKTYKAPDGYLMTKKEWVYESCSEGEEDPVPEKKFKGESEDKESGKPAATTSGTAPTKSSAVAKKDVAKNKSASPQKTKQASLTSFFKRK